MRSYHDSFAEDMKDPSFRRVHELLRPQAEIFKRVVRTQLSIIETRGVKYHRYKQLRKAAGLKEF